MDLFKQPPTNSLGESPSGDCFTFSKATAEVVIKSEFISNSIITPVKIEPDEIDYRDNSLHETSDFKSNFLSKDAAFEIVPSCSKIISDSKTFFQLPTVGGTEKSTFITKELVPYETSSLKTEYEENLSPLLQNTPKHEFESSIEDKPLVNILKFEEPDDRTDANQPPHQCKELRVILQDMFPKEATKRRPVHTSGQPCLCIFCLGSVKVKQKQSGDFELTSVSKPWERLIISGSLFPSKHFYAAYKSQVKIERFFRVTKTEKSLDCFYCPAKYQSQRHLFDHLRISHPYERPYSCKQCAKKFTSSFYLNMHVKCHSKARPFSCSQCPATFKRRNHLKSHLNTHGDLTPLPCPHCPAVFRLPAHLKNHMVRHDAKKFECAHCLSKFHAKSDLLKHLAIHSPARPYACSLCPAKFKSRANQRTHEKNHTEEKLFSCAHCPATAKRKSELVSHMATHSKEKPFSCTKCSLKFSTKGRLRQHLPAHSEIKCFSCSQCSFKTKWRNTLSKHLKFSHTNEKPFSCKLCPKRFKKEGRLNSHVARCHSKYRPFSCKWCPKAFYYRWECDKHEKIHINGRIFSCALCSAKFHSKYLVKRHLKYTHSTKKPFSCLLCSVKFKTKSSAEAHFKRHSKKE